MAVRVVRRAIRAVRRAVQAVRRAVRAVRRGVRPEAVWPAKPGATLEPRATNIGDISCFIANICSQYIVFYRLYIHHPN